MTDSAPKQFRKKPVVIEAMQYDGINGVDLLAWAGSSIVAHSSTPTGVVHSMYVGTLEGSLHISEGDWLIRGVKGEFYPCKPDIFDATYEPVSEQVQS